MQEPESETVVHLLDSIVENENRSSASKFFRKASLAIQLYSLLRKTRHYVDLLIDVHGHQILQDGVFNGDPHVSLYLLVRRFTQHLLICYLYVYGLARECSRAIQRKAWTH